MLTSRNSQMKVLDPVIACHWPRSLPLHSFREIICQECPHPAMRICGCLSIVLRPMAEHHSPGLQYLNIEGMVSSRIGDKLNGCSRTSPTRHCLHAVFGGCPVI